MLVIGPEDSQDTTVSAVICQGNVVVANYYLTRSRPYAIIFMLFNPIIRSIEDSGEAGEMPALSRNCIPIVLIGEPGTPPLCVLSDLRSKGSGNKLSDNSVLSISPLVFLGKGFSVGRDPLWAGA